LENHHVGGEANDPDLTIVLCLNHHRIATERQRRCGVELCHQPKNVLEMIHNADKGRASFALLEGGLLLERAECIARLINALDEKFPEWRNLPEAKSRVLSFR
jgi:hypothetical protein